MGVELGVVVAVAILVLMPLAALVAARLWRDPPPAKWAIPAERRAAAANDPSLVEYRLRSRLGVTDDRLWSQAHRAIRRGEAAPPELRAAARELAERRIARLDRQAPRTGKTFAMWVAAIVVSAVAAVFITLHGNAFFLVYPIMWSVRAFGASPWWLRRVRRRAAAAVAANA